MYENHLEGWEPEHLYTSTQVMLMVLTWGPDFEKRGFS